MGGKFPPLLTEESPRILPRMKDARPPRRTSSPFSRVYWCKKWHADYPNLQRSRSTNSSRGGFSRSQCLCCSWLGATAHVWGQKPLTFHVIYHWGRATRS